MTATTPRRHRRQAAAAAAALNGGALLASSSSGRVAGALLHLPLAAIDPCLNPNPRGDVDTTTESFLAFLESIRASGVLQPVGAHPHPHPEDPERVALTMGWRRYAAATIAELDTIPVYVTGLTGSALVRAIAENSAREDLSPLQEAHAIQTLMDEEGLNQVEAGKLIGRSERTVRERLRLLKLPPQVAAAIDDGEVPAYAARALQTIGEAEPERAEELVAQVRSGEISGEDVARRAAPESSSRTRRAQALALVTEYPGITIPELAEAMGLKQSYLYRILPELDRDGEVVKRDRGWYPAPSEHQAIDAGQSAALEREPRHDDGQLTLMYERITRLRNALGDVRGACTDEEPHTSIDALCAQRLEADDALALSGTAAQSEGSGDV